MASRAVSMCKSSVRMRSPPMCCGSGYRRLCTPLRPKLLRESPNLGQSIRWISCVVWPGPRSGFVAERPVHALPSLPIVSAADAASCGKPGCLTIRLGGVGER
eukprot:7526271-Alexandrium_andersonii.AAC.1